MRLSSPKINLIIKACMKASKPLIRDFGELENLQVSSKAPGDFVSSADSRTEKTKICTKVEFQVPKKSKDQNFQNGSLWT